MKSIVSLNHKKYQKNNNNKFLYLKKYYDKKNIIFCNKSSIIWDKTAKFLRMEIKKNQQNKKIFWWILMNKSRTKKPVGSKLGGGKGKINLLFKSVRKYNAMLLSLTEKKIEIDLKAINRTSPFKLKQKC